jgi:metallo-beta-lactamase family protein
MKLSFHGADLGVTGSCHLLETSGRRILVDCGMLQGSRELDEENAEPFGFDPAAIDTVLLTHAHLDHCGRLPLLYAKGFRGEIIATAATRELARLVMLDSAHLQEEDARRRARGHRRAGGEDGAPLYSVLDAVNSLDRFGRVAEYAKPIDFAPGVTATFHDAGHILGSASVLVTATELGRARRLLFSGDLGNAGRPLLRPPAPPHAADVVVMEATYGDRLHRPYAQSVEELYEAISATFQRGGNVVIPTFALERAQEILFFLKRGAEMSRVPPAMQVFLDSPMAISATQIFEHHPECYEPEVRELFREGRDPFALANLHMTRDSQDSIAINRITGGAVIMAGSGMATGGRVRHHLKHNIWREECGVIFVGFAARGTPARRIIDGAKQVRLLGEDVAVRAHIHTINGFSAHADQRELVAWRTSIAEAETTFIVHGEPPAMQALGRLLPGRVEMPALHQSFDL